MSDICLTLRCAVFASVHVLPHRSISSTDGAGYVCSFCGNRYAYLCSLNAHLEMHSGKTKCPVCEQTFGMAYTMRRHMVRIHGMKKEEVDRITNNTRCHC